MDPDNPGPSGARALARVLGDEGVDVQVARGADELEAIDVDGGTSVVVVLPEYLGTSTIERLREHTGQAHAVIVVGAGPGVADALGEPGGGASIPLDEGRESGLRRPALRRAHPRGRLHDPLYPDGRLLRRQVRRDRHRAGRRAAALRRRPGAHQRPDPAGRQRRGGAADARPGRAAGLVRAQHRRPRRRRRREPPDPAAAMGPAGAGAARDRHGHRDPLAGPPARRPRHRAAAGRGARRRDHAQPGPALPPLGRPRPRRGVAAPGRPRPGSPSGCGSAPRPHPTSWPARWPGAPAAPRRTSWPSSARPASYRPRTAT